VPSFVFPELSVQHGTLLPSESVMHAGLVAAGCAGALLLHGLQPLPQSIIHLLASLKTVSALAGTDKAMRANTAITTIKYLLMLPPFFFLFRKYIL